MADASSLLLAVSNTTAALFSLDKGPVWKSSSQVKTDSAAWLKNGRAFLTTNGGSVVLTVLDTLNQENHVLRLAAEELTARVSGDGKCLVLASSKEPGTLYVHDLPSLLAPNKGPGSAAIRPTVLRDHDQPVVAVATSPYSSYVATSSQAGSVYIHEVASPGRGHTVAALPGGAALAAAKRCLAFSQHNPPRLAAGTDDGQVLVWQLGSSGTTGPITAAKLNGRIMGVGFATYKQAPSSVLVSCSEEGLLCATDMAGFPKKMGSITVDLNEKLCCMAVRDDGLLAAVGTKDGKVGVFKVDDLINLKQNLVAGSRIRVFDLGTHLNVSDIAFQRSSGSRDLRDSREGARESKEGTVAPPGALPSSTSSSWEAASSAGSQGSNPASGSAAAGTASGAPQALREATNQYAPRPGPMRPPSGGGAEVSGTGGAQPDLQDAKAGRIANPGPGTAVATGSMQRPAASQRTVPAEATGVGPVGSEAAAPRGPPGQAPAGTSGQLAHQPPVATAGAAAAAQLASKGSRPTGVPQLQGLLASAASALALRQPDTSGGGAIGAGPLPPGAAAATGAADDGAEQDAVGLPSPVARAPAAGAAVSPSVSPARLRSPRMSTAGHIAASLPVPRVPTAGGAGGMNFGELFAQLRSDIRADIKASAAEVRSEVSEVWQKTQRLVEGLHTDIVRQGVNAETHTEEQVALLRLENAALRGEVQQLREQLQLALRFGMLGQQRTNWG